MPPISPAPLPARPFRGRVLAVPAVVCLVVGSLSSTVLSAGPALAADMGTFTIGANPIPLNQPSDPAMGALAPSADAAQNGMFGPQVAWPLIPLHAALTANGHLVSYGTPLDSASQGGLDYDDWNIAAGFDRGAHRDSPSMHDYNSFCSALVTLDDGRMLMTGGNSLMSTMLYDPATGGQDMGASLNRFRWYASTMRLTDGRVLVLGGGDYYNTGAYTNPDDDSGVATTPEIGTGTGAWTELTGATSRYAFGAEDNRWWYPRAFNGPDGTVVGTSGDHIWSLSTAGTGDVRAIGTLPFDPRVSGSQVMYEPGRVLVAGGGQYNNDDDRAATNQAAVYEQSGDARAVAPMVHARNWLNLTVLPTGDVFANGGTGVGMGIGNDSSVRQSEIWNPASGQWRTAATAQRTRTYHSVSLMLPSGAVFTGGGGTPGPEDNLNAEVYYPAYLFRQAANGRVGWASRPAITAITGSATYGGQVRLTIGDGRTIAGAALINAPSVTHSENTDQRRIPLAIVQQDGVVTATLPGSADTMPAGTYELTVTDADGVPSPAQMITIRRDGPGSVTVGPADQVTVGGAAVDNGDGDGAPAGQGGAGQPGTGVAGGQAGSTPAPTGTVPLAVDRAVGLEPVDLLGRRIERVGSRTRLRAASTTGGGAARSSWVVRPGLASAAGVSFESVDRPGHYLAAPTKSAGAVIVAKRAGTSSFAARATFVRTRGATGQNTSFRLWSKRSFTLAHSGSTVIVRPFSGTDRARASSTFVVRAGAVSAPPVPLSSGRSVTLEVVDRPGLGLTHTGVTTRMSKVNEHGSEARRGAASWIVHAEPHHSVSFESVDRPGWYLGAPGHGSGALALIRRSADAAFAHRTAFTPVRGIEGGTMFQLTARRDLVLTAGGTHPDVQTLAKAANGRVAGTFMVRSGLAPAPTR